MEGYSRASVSEHHGEYPWLAVLCAPLVGLQSSPVLDGKAQPSVWQRGPCAQRAPRPQDLIHSTVNNCFILSGSDCMLTVLPLKEGAIWRDVLLVWQAFTMLLDVSRPKWVRCILDQMKVRGWIGYCFVFWLFIFIFYFSFLEGLLIRSRTFLAQVENFQQLYAKNPPPKEHDERTLLHFTQNPCALKYIRGKILYVLNVLVSIEGSEVLSKLTEMYTWG